MQIKNIEGLTVEELDKEIADGGKFVYYQYTVSMLVMTFKRNSDIYFVKSNQKSSVKGLPYTLLSAVLGWWGIPWGPIYTIQTLSRNISGGLDVTPQIMASLVASLPTQKVTEALGR